MPKRPTRPTQYPSPPWARELQRWKPRHSCRGGRPLWISQIKLSKSVEKVRGYYTEAFAERHFGAAQHIGQGGGNRRQATGLGEDDAKAPQDQDGQLGLTEMGQIR